MHCLDTPEPDKPSTTPDEVPDENTSNPHVHTVDQVHHPYQSSKYEHSTPLSEFPTSLTCHVA